MTLALHRYLRPFFIAYRRAMNMQSSIQLDATINWPKGQQHPERGKRIISVQPINLFIAAVSK
jgi:hypothetical protein